MSDGDGGGEAAAALAFDMYVKGNYKAAIAEVEKLLAAEGSGSGDAASGGVSDALALRLKSNLALLVLLDNHRVGGAKQTCLEQLRSALQAHKKGLNVRVFDAEEGESEEDAGSYDADTSKCLYNYALLCFADRQYAKAQSVLEGVWLHVALADEATAIATASLLLDVLIHSARGGLTSAASTASFNAKTAPLLEFLGRYGDDEAAEAAPRAPEDRLPSFVRHELQFRAHLYNAKVALLLCNHRSPKKELKSALELYQRELRDHPEATAARVAGVDAASALLPLPPSDRANATALFLKANSEYLRANYRKALKLLGAASSATADAHVRISYLNDMGCLHLKMQRQKAALQYFHRALSELGAAPAPAAPLPDAVFAPPREEVLYNLGLQLLAAAKPREAFAMLRASAALYTHRPRLWIRLAECCIAADAQRGLEGRAAARGEAQGGGAGAYGDLVRRVVGKGRSRRVLLPLPEAPSGGGGGGGGGDGLGCSLRDAVLYLKGALLLAPAPASWEDREALAVHSAALCHLAYVYLRLGAGLDALLACEMLNALPSPPAPAGEEGEGEGEGEGAAKDLLCRRFLAHTYAAEALCLMDRPADAGARIEHMALKEPQVSAAAQRSASAGLGVAGPAGMLRPDRLPSLVPAGADATAAAPAAVLPEKRVQSDAQVNLATVALLQNNLAAAQRHMEMALQLDAFSPRARRTLVYLLLRYGHTERALRVLKGAVP